MTRRLPPPQLTRTLALGLVLPLLLSICLAQAHHLHEAPEAPTACGAGLCGHAPPTPDPDDNPATCARCAFTARPSKLGVVMTSAGWRRRTATSASVASQAVRT